MRRDFAALRVSEGSLEVQLRKLTRNVAILRRENLHGTGSNPPDVSRDLREGLSAVAVATASGRGAASSWKTK
jgi:hypothetical protein